GSVRESVRREFPRRSAVAGSVHAEPVFGRVVGRVVVLLRLLRNHVRDVRILRIEREPEAETGRQAVAVQTLLVVTAVVRAIDAAVILLPEAIGSRRPPRWHRGRRSGTTRPGRLLARPRRPRIDHGVGDRPARKQRSFDVPGSVVVSAAEEEEALLRADG